MDKSVRTHFIVLFLAAAMLLVAASFITTQTAYADNTLNVKWDTTKDSSGVVTNVKLKWDNVTGLAYMIEIKRDGKIIKQEQVTSNPYDCTSLILNNYDCGEYEATVMGSMSGGAIFSEAAPLKMYRVTIDTQGHGDDVVLKNVLTGTSAFTAIKNGYIDKLGQGAFPVEFYENGQALIGVNLYSKDHYSNMADMSERMLYSLPLGGINASIGGNVKVYAIWFDVIDKVDLTVEPPACGDTTDTTKNSKEEWNWDSQTNPPVLSVPEGSPYHFDSAGNKGSWDATEEGKEPFRGTFEAGKSYWFDTYLESDYGYVFPGQSDGIDIDVNMTGGTFSQWFNDDYCFDGDGGKVTLYGKWLDPDEYYGTTPLYITGKVAVTHEFGDWQPKDADEHIRYCGSNQYHSETEAHNWDDGKVTTPVTLESDGVMTYTCEKCKLVRTETIPNSNMIGLVDIGNVWTNLDLIHDAAFTAEINPDGVYKGTRLQDMMMITDETWESTDGTSTVSISAPGKLMADKTYKYTVEVTAKGDYIFGEGFDFIYGGSPVDSADITFSANHKKVNISGFVPDATLQKLAGPLTLKAKTATVKYSKLKKKTQTLGFSKAVKVSNVKGTLSYAKATGNKKITINKKTGKITVKKGLKKGTYKVKAKVTDSGNNVYKKTTKSVTFKVRVK